MGDGIAGAWEIIVSMSIVPTSKSTLDAFKSKNTLEKSYVISWLMINIIVLLLASMYGIVTGIINQNMNFVVLSSVVFVIMLWFFLKDFVWRKK